MDRAVGREIHGRHLLGQLLQALRRDAPVLIDDPGRNDRFVDAGQQVYQLMEISLIEAKLSITGSDCGTVDDRLDLVRIAAAHKSP